MDINFSQTCFQAVAILQACETKDFNSLHAANLLGVTADTLEQERQEVLEAIVSDMGGSSDGLGSWDVHRRLLVHLAQPPISEVSKLVQ